MKYLGLFFGFIIYSTGFAKYTDSFIVNINEESIKVTAPKKQTKNVSIIIKNETFDKIVSELRSDKKVLKRFILQPEKNEVIQIDYSKVKNLFYVPLSPPFEAAQLRFSQESYEIP